MSKTILESKYIKNIFITPAGSWFGYYNYDTLNHNQTKMLCNRTNNDASKVEKGMKIEIGYYEIPSGEWRHIGESDSYNWQQGAMLQWLPGEGNGNKVIFNTSDGNHNIAKIVDISTNEEKKIDWSIYGLTPDGKKSITLNFERSHWCRAYHYESIANEAYNVQVAEDDGVYEIDLEKNTRRRIVSIQDVIQIDKEEYFNNAKHWLEHIMISPSGSHFCFLHRFTTSSLDNYETRLFVANIDGSNLKLIKGWRDYYWSHFGWNIDNSFAIYACKNTIHNRIIEGVHTEKPENSTSNNNLLAIIRKAAVRLIPYSLKEELRRKIIGQDCGYQYYSLHSGDYTLNHLFNQGVFSIDGHPSFTSDGRYMITDSYPDEKQYQRLVVLDLLSQKTLCIGKFYAGLFKQFGSCDLHPKLCANNDYIAIDTAFDGLHHMILYKLDWNKIKNKLK